MGARALLTGVGLLLTTPGLAAECESPTTARDLADASTRFYAAWDQLDETGVATALAEAETAVQCADEPLTPPDVVTYFQLTGLAAFLADDSTRARDAFRAALGVLPSYSLPSTVAAPGDDWYEMYEALRSIPDDGRTGIPLPEHGWVHVDGARAEERPTARPWLLQQFDGTGAVVQTAIVWTGEEPPGLQAVEEPPPEPEETEDEDVVPATHQSRGLVIAGGAATIAGIASLAGASKLKQDYQNGIDKGRPPDKSLVAPNYLLGTLGYTGTGTGLGLITGAIVLKEW